MPEMPAARAQGSAAATVMVSGDIRVPYAELNGRAGASAGAFDTMEIVPVGALLRGSSLWRPGELTEPEVVKNGGTAGCGATPRPGDPVRMVKQSVRG
ncbi:hypothetical protein [Streptomyces sp. NPDC048248]|uniref:hypothetical protein n=1 Tax=Streptomyces sp. NPDC048248 TaxID=3365523 RepID=UPI00371C1849